MTEHDERACAEQNGDCACIPMTDPRYVAEDGAPITDGARMYNYYDGYYVTIKISGTSADPASPYHATWDGWYNTEREDGTRGPILNNQRLAGAKPAWMKDK